jgi:hypothetical protein
LLGAAPAAATQRPVTIADWRESTDMAEPR